MHACMLNMQYALVFERRVCFVMFLSVVCVHVPPSKQSAVVSSIVGGVVLWRSHRRSMNWAKQTGWASRLQGASVGYILLTLLQHLLFLPRNDSVLKIPWVRLYDSAAQSLWFIEPQIQLYPPGYTRTYEIETFGRNLFIRLWIFGCWGWFLQILATQWGRRIIVNR